MMKCRYGCDRSFQNIEDMRQHRDAFHRLNFTCGECKQTFRSPEAVRQHKKASHPIIQVKDFNCMACAQKFKSLDAMKQHAIACHSDSASKRCRSANRKVAATTIVTCPQPQQSKRRQQISVAACNDCGREFSSIDALRMHQMTQPDHIRLARGSGSLQCEACNRSLRDQAALEQHFVADHSVIQLPNGAEKEDLILEFKQKWRKPWPPGRVFNVFKVYNLGWRVRSFEQYRASLKKVVENENEVQRYHGTSILCDLGVTTKRSKLCCQEGCSLCSILRSGFKTAKARLCWQRFGKGIYTTATSGKANDYILGDSSRRVLLVCRVLAGKPYVTLMNQPFLNGPPEGYHSVSGEVGKDLNYDETVVYSSKAILPGYMIVYTMDE